MIGLTPSQYKCYAILKAAKRPLKEKEIRDLWTTIKVNYTAYFRQSTCNVELRALCALGLAERERNGRGYLYKIKEREHK